MTPLRAATGRPSLKVRSETDEEFTSCLRYLPSVHRLEMEYHSHDYNYTYSGCMIALEFDAKAGHAYKLTGFNDTDNKEWSLCVMDKNTGSVASHPAD